MQIIIYLPSPSWIKSLVLVKVTCGNGFKSALQKDRAVDLPDILTGVIKNADTSFYSRT